MALFGSWGIVEARTTKGVELQEYVKATSRRDCQIIEELAICIDQTSATIENLVKMKNGSCSTSKTEIFDLVGSNLQRHKHLQILTSYDIPRKRSVN